MKKYMTLNDLYSFYFSNGLSRNFEDSDSPLAVQVPGTLQFEKNSSDTDGMRSVRLQMNFVGENLNGSNITMKSQKAALPSSKFRPILGYIWKDDKGNYQFAGHEFHKEGSDIVYDEKPIGVVSEAAHIEHDEEYDKDYAVSLGYIWDEYSPASQIIEREGACDVSVELSIRKLSYDSETKVLNLDDFFYTGVTLLGYREGSNMEKVNPAMPGSNATLADFSANNNSMFSDIEESSLVKHLERFNEMLNKLNDKISIITRKEETSQVKFEELLKKYNKTVEEITFQYEGLNDAELETAFVEAFGEVETETTENVTATEETVVTDEAVVEETVVTDETEPEAETVVTDETDVNPETVENEPEAEVVEDNTDTLESVVESDQNETVVAENIVTDNTAEFKFNINGSTKTFSVSLNDKIGALCDLVNATYSEIDGDYYDVVVFEDDKYVEMHSYWSRKHYRQQFSVKKDVYTLIGDRVELFSRYMTQDEINAFNKMKSDFEELKQNYQLLNEKFSKNKVRFNEMPIPAYSKGTSRYGDLFSK